MRRAVRAVVIVGVRLALTLMVAGWRGFMVEVAASFVVSLVGWVAWAPWVSDRRLVVGTGTGPRDIPRGAITGIAMDYAQGAPALRLGLGGDALVVMSADVRGLRAALA